MDYDWTTFLNLASRATDSTLSKSVRDAALRGAAEWIEDFLKGAPVHNVVAFLNFFIDGLGELATKIPPGAYTVIFSFIGNLLEESAWMKANYPRLGSGARLLVESGGTGFGKAMRDADASRATIDVATFTALRGGIVMNLLNTLSGVTTVDDKTTTTPTATPKKRVEDVIGSDQMASFAGLKWAIDRAIAFDPPAEGATPVAEWFNTLDGKANHLRTAWEVTAQENPELFEKHLPKGVSFEDVRDNPMRHGREIFSLLLTIVPPTKPDMLWDTVDLWLPLPTVKKWAKDNLTPNSWTFWVLGILFVLGVALVAGTFSAAWVLWALGVIALFGVSAVGVLGGLFTWVQYPVEALWAFNLGVAGVYISAKLWNVLGKTPATARDVFLGRKTGGDGFFYRFAWRVRRSMETLGIPLLGKLGEEPREGEEPPVKGNGWFHDVGTSVTLVTLGVAVAFNVITLAFYPGWYRLAAQGTLAFFWFVGFYTDFSTRNAWRYTDEEHKSHRTKIRDGLEKQMFFALRIGAGVIFVGLLVSFVTLILPAFFGKAATLAINFADDQVAELEEQVGTGASSGRPGRKAEEPEAAEAEVEKTIASAKPEAAKPVRKELTEAEREALEYLKKHGRR